MPWISLILGVLTLWAAYALWRWAHVANTLIDYANQISSAFGGSDIVSNRMTVGVWIALIMIVVEGVLYLAAFPATKARKKSGWNLLFYAALINVVYATVLLFSDYGGVGNFIFSLIGSAIGLWLLFQIRSVYSGRTAAPTAG